VVYRVFSQETAAPDTERLVGHASRFFAAKLDLLERSPGLLRVRLSSAKPAFDSELTLRVRDVTREDVQDARDAEARGRAAGMSALAEKCTRIWEIEPAHGFEPALAACVSMSGICASIALGPVLPPDHSTLFGVRGALERLALLG
jgi:hypothetical protein